MNLDINISTTAGEAKLQRLLKAMEPKTLLDLIGGRLLSHVNKQFKTRGEGRWAALAPSTLLLRKRGGDAPLQDTGRLKGSYVSEVGGPGRDYSTDGQTFVEVGSNVKTESGHSLAKIHELGTGPYTIRVKRARVLAARTRFGQWLIFGKEVHHPGIPARPVLPTKAVAERLVSGVIDGALARVEGKG